MLCKLKTKNFLVVSSQVRPCKTQHRNVSFWFTYEDKKNGSKEENRKQRPILNMSSTANRLLKTQKSSFSRVKDPRVDLEGKEQKEEEEEVQQEMDIRAKDEKKKPVGDQTEEEEEEQNEEQDIPVRKTMESPPYGPSS